MLPSRQTYAVLEVAQSAKALVHSPPSARFPVVLIQSDSEDSDAWAGYPSTKDVKAAAGLIDTYPASEPDLSHSSHLKYAATDLPGEQELEQAVEPEGCGNG